MEANVISTRKVVVKAFHPGLPTLRMIDHVVDALQGEAETSVQKLGYSKIIYLDCRS